MRKKLYKSSFVLSLLFHALLFLSMITIITSQHPEKEKPQGKLYIPSYIYKSASLSTHSTQSSRDNQSSQSAKNNLPADKNGIQQKSIMELSRDTLRNMQFETAMSHQNDEEPILLIGNENESVDPLIRIMARSLSAHFKYPTTEGILGTTGKVLVKFVLHPEGYYSDIEIIGPSGVPAFNAAALYAINTAPRVVNAHQFLDRPKQFVVGFIFDTM